MEEENNTLHSEIHFIKEEESTEKTDNQEIFPLLPVRNTVIFPRIILPITAGRKSSIQLLRQAYEKKQLAGILTQPKSQIEHPSPNDLFSVGTVVQIIKLIDLEEGKLTALVRGIYRFRKEEIISTDPFITGKIKPLEEARPRKKDLFVALVDNIRDLACKTIELDPSIPNGATSPLRDIEDTEDLLNFICINSPLNLVDKQKLLEEKSLQKRAERLYELLYHEFQKIELKVKIHQKTSRDMDRQQREYYLSQQIRSIQEELGGGAESDEEELRKKASKCKWSEEVQKHFEKELHRLLRNNPNSPDYNIQRNYLDFFTDLPWQKYSKDNFDITRAKKILDRDHLGLENAKKRLLEHMAVLKLRAGVRAPILCLEGPPGVGKTSLGKSLADALGRKYIRISLGGLHDESEIRGHRRTYIGSMAGRLLQSIKKAGTSNPLIVLDEIDKIGHGNHGDPSSALLEVLDPEQNHSFYDNFLELGYDLSQVMFVATANDTSQIQGPLLDRMEVLNIAGYTLQEKVDIAKKHLLRRALEENGLDKKSLKLSDEQVYYIIEAHTREAGVRGLQKALAQVSRWAALEKALNGTIPKNLNKEKLDEILGLPRFLELIDNEPSVGVVTGLAWTRAGGDILYIESLRTQGTGNIGMTGNLGSVMKESATIAQEYIKSKHESLGIDWEILSKSNIHIHVPEGATPKDGPSAGIALLTSMVSTYTGRAVRPKVAMTGEITLRGRVLPVGGIKEKVLAAARFGIKEIILCHVNQKDINEIPSKYLDGLQIHYVTRMEEVLDIALEK